MTYNIFVKRVGKGKRVSLKVNGKHVHGEVVPLPTEDATSVEVGVALEDNSSAYSEPSLLQQSLN
ncbi:MAG: hypothetical protein FGF51_01145 [Candidatus Brockarchaeota archaeon]|nr:hypothetical protein [Candidatus Brockarchaeota archaeon]